MGGLFRVKAQKIVFYIVFLNFRLLRSLPSLTVVMAGTRWFIDTTTLIFSPSLCNSTNAKPRLSSATHGWCSLYLSTLSGRKQVEIKSELEMISFFLFLDYKSAKA